MVNITIALTRYLTVEHLLRLAKSWAIDADTAICTSQSCHSIRPFRLNTAKRRRLRWT
jgi:hypothetical protein